MEFTTQEKGLPELFAPLFKKIDNLLSAQERVCVALDGRCCAGKTTLAKYIEQNYPCAVAHMDHFFLPPELRTAKRLNTPGGNVHYERFLKEVSPILTRRGEFSYRAYDCRTGNYYVIQMPDAPLVIVEGSYSHHPQLSGAYDLKVFLTLSKEAQWERLTTREIPEKLPRFQSEWLPMEELYFSELRIPERADLVFNTWLGRASARTLRSNPIVR